MHGSDAPASDSDSDADEDYMVIASENPVSPTQPPRNKPSQSNATFWMISPCSHPIYFPASFFLSCFLSFRSLTALPLLSLTGVLVNHEAGYIEVGGIDDESFDL